MLSPDTIPEEQAQTNGQMGAPLLLKDGLDDTFIGSDPGDGAPRRIEVPLRPTPIECVQGLRNQFGESPRSFPSSSPSSSRPSSFPSNEREAERIVGGLTSFVLSAGLGPLTQATWAFLRTIPEDEPMVPQRMSQTVQPPAQVVANAAHAQAMPETNGTHSTGGPQQFMIGSQDSDLGAYTTNTSSQPTSQPTRLVDFHVLERLGGGGFGTVHKVYLPSQDKYYAMKELSQRKYRAQNVREKARTEEYLLKTLDHPFIVRLHFAYHNEVVPGDWFMIMDLCPNGDLNDYIVKHTSAEQPGLPLKECARFLGQILLAIEYIHAASVIFRDLKPDNVVLDEQNRAKLVDFGLAKRVDPGTAHLSFSGSPGFMAPEIQNQPHYTKSVDMYSMGVTLYVMAAGGDKQYYDNPPEEHRVPPRNHPLLLEALQKCRESPELHNQNGNANRWPEQSTLAFIEVLTSWIPNRRPNPVEAKANSFFSKHLRTAVNELLPSDFAAFCSTMGGASPIRSHIPPTQCEWWSTIEE